MGLTPRQTAGRAHRATGPASGTGPIPAAQSDGAPRDRVCPIPAPRPMAVRAAALVLARSQRLASTGRAELHRGALRAPCALAAQSMARRRDQRSPAPEICGFPGGSAARGTARPALMKTRYSGLIAVGDRPADDMPGLACGDEQVSRRSSTLGPAFALGAGTAQRARLASSRMAPLRRERGEHLDVRRRPSRSPLRIGSGSRSGWRVRGGGRPSGDGARVARGAGARSVSRGQPL